MAKHRGRFRWKKYSRYKGNMRVFWTSKHRTPMHAKPDDA